MQPFTFFISYRREDTAPIALLLKREIERRLQYVRVTVDVEDIKAGEQFPDRLKAMIEQAHATIVLIGKNWMPRTAGQSIAPEDWVVEELKLSRSAPILYNPADRYGLAQRCFFPLFINCDLSFQQFQLPEDIQFLTAHDARRIDYANWPSAIGPVVAEMANRFGLKRRRQKGKVPTADAAKARTQAVSEAELTSTLSYDDYQGWYVDNVGRPDRLYLMKSFHFHDFDQAALFMQRVSEYCSIMEHHPLWSNAYNQVNVSLTTWDAKNKITIYDLNAALYMNKVAEAIAKQKKS